jgi:hypothetical protein
MADITRAVKEPNALLKKWRAWVAKQSTEVQELADEAEQRWNHFSDKRTGYLTGFFWQRVADAFNSEGETQIPPARSVNHLDKAAIVAHQERLRKEAEVASAAYLQVVRQIDAALSEGQKRPLLFHEIEAERRRLEEEAEEECRKRVAEGQPKEILSGRWYRACRHCCPEMLAPRP